MRKARDKLEAMASQLGEARPFQPGTDQERIDLEEISRVRFALMVALEAKDIPRRLGAEAGRDEQARDKRVSNRVSHVYESRLRWEYRIAGIQPLPRLTGAVRVEFLSKMPPKARQLAATVEWCKWLSHRTRELEARRARIARLAIEQGLVRWGVRRCNAISREIEGLQAVLWELDPGRPRDTRERVRSGGPEEED